MQEAVKTALVIAFVITCILSYWYYGCNVNRNFLLTDDNLNSEQPSDLESSNNRNHHIGTLQDDHDLITYVTKTTNPRDVFISKANNHGQYLPNSTNPSIVLHSTDKGLRGYILPYSIWEEQTSGANNLWQLQIWAKQVGMYVVEPFARDSYFTMRGVIPNFGQALRFGDYYDKEEWDRMVVRAGGNPLVKWEEFITNSPRDAIILYTVRRENANPSLTIAYDENATAVCGKLRVSKKDMIWIKKTFNVIKTVCYFCATNIAHPLSLRKFNTLVFHDYVLRPNFNNVTLIVVNWIGIRTVRVHINPLTLFYEPLQQKLTFPPSQRIMTAYKTYIQQYIGHYKYVGIIFRTHHVLNFSPLTGSFANQSKYLLQCSKNLSKVLDPIRKEWKIFLAYDMGLFGSKSYATRNQLTSLQEQIFLDVFNGSLQINEREENLRKAANRTDRGLIAQLEKVIATRADCIILLGPKSTFVKSSSFMYLSQHHSKKCIVTICADEVYDHLGVVISSHTIPNEFRY